MPRIRTHRRAPRELVMRSRGSWDRVPPNAGFHSHCAWHSVTTSDSPRKKEVCDLTLGRLGKSYAGFFLRYIPESQPFVPYFSSTAIHLYSTGLLHIKFISVWVEVAPTYLLPCCSQSYFHYWYMVCYLCNSLYLEKQWWTLEGKIEFNCLNSLVAIGVNPALHHPLSHAYIAKPASTPSVIKLVRISVT